jgi:hypothetical protein
MGDTTLLQQPINQSNIEGNIVAEEPLFKT